MPKKSILHILKSTKRDLNIVNLYNSIEEAESVFLFDEKYAKTKNSENNYQYLKNLNNVFFYTKNNYPKLYKNAFDYVFVYGLNNEQIKICHTYLSENTILVWKSLGGEIYNNNFINQEDIYQPETLKILRKLGKIKTGYKNLVYSLFKKYSSSNNFFRRVNFVSPMLKNEMRFINNNKQMSAEYIRIPLGDNTFNKLKKISKINTDAKDLYVGSSAAASSNHLDVFKKLSKLNFKNDIHVTLSYKINKSYQKIILEAGYKLFGNKFKPQTKFSSKADFINTLDKCKVAIFNINKQEGLYTISLCLEKGMKVFLSDKSPMYDHLKEMGYNVYSFQDEFTLDTINSKETSLPTNVSEESVFLFDEVQAVKDALKKMSS